MIPYQFYTVIRKFPKVPKYTLFYESEVKSAHRRVTALYGTARASTTSTPRPRSRLRPRPRVLRRWTCRLRSSVVAVYHLLLRGESLPLTESARSGSRHQTRLLKEVARWELCIMSYKTTEIKIRRVISIPTYVRSNWAYQGRVGAVKVMKIEETIFFISICLCDGKHVS